MKGALDLLHVMEMLHREDSSYLLVVIGNSTPEWDRALCTVSQDVCRDLSYVTEHEKEICFALCDVFCMPSISESFGLVYLEAWHKKKPVISADIPAVKELIEECGICIPFGDRIALLRAIRSLFHDQARRDAMGDRGYHRLQAYYDIDKVVGAYMDFF